MEIVYAQDQLRAVWQLSPPGAGTRVGLDQALAQEMALLHLRADALEGSFSAHEQGPELMFGVLFVARGSQSIRMKQAGLTLNAGEVAVWRNDVSCDFKTHDRIEKWQVLIPGPVMHRHWPGLAPDAGCLRLNAHSAMPALALGFLESLWRRKEHLEAAELQVALHATLDLLHKGQQMVPTPRPPGIDRLSPILRFIDDALEDPALGPSTIARQFGISLRTLHALFAGRGHTVAGAIRERRLEQCRQALQHDAGTGLGISELALRWGFSDAAHFSKLFKSRYGMGPRAYRDRPIPSRPGADTDPGHEG